MYRILVFVLMLFAGSSHAANVSVDPSLAAATQQLAIEQERNIVARDRLQELQREKQQQIKTLQPEQVELEDLHRAELDINLLHVDLSAITLTLADVVQTINTLTQSIQDIKQQLQDAAFAPTGTASLSAADIQKLNLRLETQRQLLKLQQKRLTFLKESQTLVKNRLEIQQEWKASLEEAYESHEHSKRQRALEQLESSMQQEQQKWIERLAALNKQTKMLVEKGKTQTPEYVNLNLRIFEAEERGNMSQLQSNLMQLRLQIADEIATRIDRAQSINDWNSVNVQIDTILARLEKMRTLIEGKIDLIQQRKSIESEGKASGILDAKGVQVNLNLLNDLAARNQQQLKTVDALVKQLSNYQAQVTKNLRSAVSRRQGLPGFNFKEWVSLGKKLAGMPVLAWDFAKTVQKQLVSSIDRMSVWKQSFFVLLGFLWFGLCVSLSRTLTSVLAHFHETHYWTATNILEVLLKLTLHNLRGIFVFVTLLLTFWMTQMPSKVYTLAVSVGVIWFGTQFALDWARITLFENAKDNDGHDVKLYSTIRWVMLIASLLILFIVLSYQLPVAYEVRDFFSRVSMLFLLGIAFALLKGRKLILSVLYPYLARNHHYLKRHYLKRIFHLISLLFPLMLIVNALVGLVGYLELSWTIAQYQAYFLLIFTGYLIARGLLRDLTEWLSGLVIRRLRNGWLWSEAILKPLDRLCNAILVVLATLTMFSLIEQGQESFISNKIFEWLQIRLGSISGNEVTLIMLFKLAIAIIILFWLGRWSREFAYRWFFVNMKDVGLRNSLSVFSQYIAVVVGIFICLRILGLNMVAFAAILTGLAIGIGFGLRDLANNFVSGIFLLIERPVRKGDLVTIAGHEGEVTHIGMRSLTVYTGDHTEVIVPHSEAYSKTFVNWTLQDSIVRGTVVIKIARDDDPHAIQTALVQVLKETQGVVANPLPEVLLKDINETAIEFQIHYFINLQVTPFRSVMRSTVLFSVWDCLSKMGIRPLHAQQDVHIKALPAG